VLDISAEGTRLASPSDANELGETREEPVVGPCSKKLNTIESTPGTTMTPWHGKGCCGCQGTKQVSFFLFFKSA